MANSRICSIPNCGKTLVARGWCSGHWQRWSNHGDPLYVRPAVVCSIVGCNKPNAARGWCMTHWQRWSRYGDPNYVLKPLKAPRGDPRRYFESVVLTYEGDECLPWPYLRDSKGCGRLSVDRKPKIVARLVCIEANGPPPTTDHHAAHSCGKGHEGCVAKRHLSWKTKIENEADKIIHGTIPRGERQWLAKLTEDDVRKVMAMKGSFSQKAIANLFGVSRSCIQLIHAGKSWRHVSC